MTSGQLGIALRQLDRLFNEGTASAQSDAQLLERFVVRRDETAFEAMVARHGAMVLSTCRGVLRNRDDAEDAFQATFLVLARKAGTIRVEGSLGSWLHRVACRIAVQANVDASRRRDKESQGVAIDPIDERSLAPDADLRPIVHEEIDRLPERFRAPIVLCYLEGLSYEEVASHLRWSVGTVGSRLARARSLMRSRLTRRGVTLAGGALATLLTSQASADVRKTLADSALRASSSRAARVLADKVLKGMLWGALRSTIVYTALVAMTATGLVVFGKDAASSPPGAKVPGAGKGSDPDPRHTPARQDRPADKGPEVLVTYRGRVLDPEGRPKAGVSLDVLVSDAKAQKTVIQPQGRSDGEGRFRAAVPKSLLDGLVGRPEHVTLPLVATAEGFGPDWVDIRNPSDAELTLRLVPDDVPIVGRILDLQGRPVVGAKITLNEVMAEPEGNLDPYLKLVREDPFTASNRSPSKRFGAGPGLPGQPASVTTDAEGRFRLAGIGRERLVELGIEGPSIASGLLSAMTRRSDPVVSPRGEPSGPIKVYGATFDHLVPPGRALTGVVRDKQTREPLAGVSVIGLGMNLHTVTDHEGRYHLAGFPKDKSYPLLVSAGRKPPYFVTSLRVSDVVGLEPIRADVDCVAGVLFRLTLIDSATGKPVTGAEVSYDAIYPNPHSEVVRGSTPVNAWGSYSSGIEEPAGTYTLGVLPGPGAVLVRSGGGIFRPACVDPQEFFKDVKTQGTISDQRFGHRRTLYITMGGDTAGMPQEQFSAIVLVNPAEGSAPLNREVVMERDRPRQVRVFGPDGKPLDGVKADGAEATAEPGVLTVSRLNPMRPRRFVFRQDDRKLVGFLLAKGDEPEPYSVRLRPWGTVVGRLVDAEGRPRPNVDLSDVDWRETLYDPKRGSVDKLKTDADGRFRLEALVPGQSYSASAVGKNAEKGGFGVVIDRVVLKPGETRDLGDVRAIPPAKEANP